MFLHERVRGWGREHFDPNQFREPDVEHWPVYTWLWNDTITREGIRDQLEAMKARGIRGTYIISMPEDYRPDSRPTPLYPDYDTDEYYALYRYAAEYAAELGMSFWFYDEAGFPSGSADGRVVMANPDVEKKGLIRSQRMLKQGETYTPPDDILGAFVLDTYPINGSYTADRDILLAEYRVVVQKPYPMPIPDLLDSRMSDILLRVVYEKYKSHIGHMFGGAIQIAFIDEPAAPVHPWTYGFETLFYQQYGYNIKEYLPALLNPYLQGEKGTRARLDYYELNSELLVKHYYLPQWDWCRQNKLLFGGHLGGEDETDGCARHGYYHPLRMLRTMDVPGVDAIWRQIFPGAGEDMRSNLGNTRTCRNHFFPRLASSAANQTGGNLSLTESNAVYGAGLTYAQNRFITLFQAVRGINLFNYMSVSYGRGEHLMASMRPNLVEELPHSTDLAVFNAYVARLSYLMTAGRIDVRTALYMPVRDIWADDCRSARSIMIYEAAAYTLEHTQCYFDLFDDDVVRAADDAALERGVIQMGLAEYDTLVVPPCRFMPEEVQVRLGRFIAGGGRVITLGDEMFPALSGAYVTDLDGLPGLVQPVITVSPSNGHIQAIRRVLPDGAALYLVTNEDDIPLSCAVCFPETRIVYELDMLDGGFYAPMYRRGKVETELDLRFDSGEGRVFLFIDKALSVSTSKRQEPVNWVCQQTLTNFRFRRLGRFVIGEKQLEWEALSEPELEMALGDWTATTGADFSGSALYSTTFLRPEGAGTVFLDLGDVKYCCEAFLNGISLGVRVMAPYTYAVEPDMLLDTNKLDIRVSNTAANQFVAKDKWLTEKYTLKQLGQYHPLSVYFEHDSLSSGLFGPVRILY